MANATGSNNFNQQNDVDAYLEAFISGTGSANSEVNLEESEQGRRNLTNQEALSPRTEYPQRVNEPQPSKDFPPARDEVQQLRRFLGEAQAKSQVRRTPSPWNSNLKRGLKLIKTFVVVVGVSFASINLYKYYQGCTRTNNCLWNLTLAFPQTGTKHPLQEATPQAPQPLLTEPFREGVRKATSAVVLAKTAKKRDEWDVIVDQWIAAISLMNSVPRSSSRFDLAQQKTAEYIDYLTYAQQEAKFAATQDETSVPLEHDSVQDCPTQQK